MASGVGRHQRIQAIGERDVAISAGRIANLGRFSSARAGQVLNCRGLHILPGVIDTQVHFREPGGEHKEDLHTGSRAAVMGGVTAVFEMPNTAPPTTSAEALNEKLRRAKGRAHVDHAFYIGATTASQPAAPPGAVNVSPAAEQPARDEEGNPLPVQPGEPEENQPVLNAPTAQAPAQPAPGGADA